MRSSVTKPIPFLIASAGLFIETSFPSIKTSPEEFPRHAPKIDIKSSLRPAPIKPEIPRTSPFGREMKHYQQFFIGTSGSKAVIFLTSSAIFAEIVRCFGENIADFAPDHQSDNFIFIKRERAFGADRLPVAQNRDAVAHLQKLHRVCAKYRSFRHRVFSNHARMSKSVSTSDSVSAAVGSSKTRIFASCEMLWQFRPIAADRFRDFRPEFADQSVSLNLCRSFVAL